MLDSGHARRRRPMNLAVDHLTRSLELNPNVSQARPCRASDRLLRSWRENPERGLKVFLSSRRSGLARVTSFAIYAPTVRYMALFALEEGESGWRCAAPLLRSILITPAHGGRQLSVWACLIGLKKPGTLSRIHSAFNPIYLSSAHVEQNTVFSEPSDRNRFLLGLPQSGHRVVMCF